MTASSLSPTARLGTTVAGRYRLESLLGQGGMGEVYVAVQEPLGRKVALKLIRTSLREHAAAGSRFEREARSLAALTHPNIVTLFDFGRVGATGVDGVDGSVDDGAMFMAMELLPGESLRRRLERAGRLPPKQALSYVADICRALEAAHRAGIVHRDLKPDNVMLADFSKSGGPVDVVKVLDFGIARLQGAEEGQPNITQTGHIVGTPGYIAPEMFTEGVLDDPRSDLYAVGVLTWELLTNAALFDAKTPVMLLMKHAQETPPTLSLFAGAAAGNAAPPHPALDTLLAKLLHKDRTHRFASAAAVVAAIAALPPEALLPFSVERQAGPGALAGAATQVKRRVSSLAPEASTMADTLDGPSALSDRLDADARAVAGGVDVGAGVGVDVGAATLIRARADTLATGSLPAMLPVALPSSSAASPSAVASRSSGKRAALLGLVVVVAVLFGALLVRRLDRRRERRDPPVTAPTPATAPVPTPIAAPVVAPTPTPTPISPTPVPPPAATEPVPVSKPTKPRTKPTKPTTKTGQPHVPDLSD